MVILSFAWRLGSHAARLLAMPSPRCLREQAEPCTGNRKMVISPVLIEISSRFEKGCNGHDVSNPNK